MKPRILVSLAAATVSALAACSAFLTVDANPTVVAGDGGGGDDGSPGTDAPRGDSPVPCSGTIGVRIAYDQTGPTKGVGIPAGKGTYDYLRNVNANGGLNGCMLDLDVQDTKYDKATTIAVYNAWKADPKFANVVAIFIQGTPMTEVIGPLAQADGKVVISGSFAGEFGSPAPITQNLTVETLNDSFATADVPVSKQSAGFPYVFFQGTDYSTGARIAMNYVWQQGAKRVAFFRCTTSPFCTDPPDAAKTFLKLLNGTQIGRDLAVELADSPATIASKVLTFFQQEQAYQQSNPSYVPVDWVWAGNTATTSIGIIQALQQVKSQLGINVSVIANNWGFNEDVYTACPAPDGGAGSPCVGAVVEQPFPIFGDLSVPGMSALLLVHQTYRNADQEDSSLYSNVQYVYGYVAADTWQTAMLQVINQGLPITSDSVKQVMETFKNRDIDGFGAFTYSSTDHRPQSTGRLYQLDSNGKLNAVGQPISIELQQAWLGW
jgi:hypothetical protein